MNNVIIQLKVGVILLAVIKNATNILCFFVRYVVAENGHQNEKY